jgi:hypothetical protein
MIFLGGFAENVYLRGVISKTKNDGNIGRKKTNSRVDFRQKTQRTGTVTVLNQ